MPREERHTRWGCQQQRQLEGKMGDAVYRPEVMQKKKCKLGSASKQLQAPQELCTDGPTGVRGRKILSEEEIKHPEFKS